MNRTIQRCAPGTFCVAWQFIDWNKVYKKVKSLQQRIVKATREGRYNKAKSLQWMLTHSFAAKLLAVKRVTENTGKNTAGIDGVIWNTPLRKLTAAKSLTRKGYKAKPLNGYIYPRKTAGNAPWVFLRCMTGLCRHFTCWRSTRFPKLQPITVLMVFDLKEVVPMPLQDVLSICQEAIVQHGYWKQTSKDALIILATSGCHSTS